MNDFKKENKMKNRTKDAFQTGKSRYGLQKLS